MLMFAQTRPALVALALLGACSAAVTVPSVSSVPSTPIPRFPASTSSVLIVDNDEDVKGRVTAVTDISIMLIDEKGVTRTVAVPAGTQISINGSVVPLSILKIGDRVEMKLLRNETGALMILKITREDDEDDDEVEEEEDDDRL